MKAIDSSLTMTPLLSSVETLTEYNNKLEALLKKTQLVITLKGEFQRQVPQSQKVNVERTLFLLRDRKGFCQKIKKWTQRLIDTKRIKDEPTEQPIMFQPYLLASASKLYDSEAYKTYLSAKSKFYDEVNQQKSNGMTLEGMIQQLEDANASEFVIEKAKKVFAASR